MNGLSFEDLREKVAMIEKESKELSKRLKDLAHENK